MEFKYSDSFCFLFLLVWTFLVSDVCSYSMDLPRLGQVVARVLVAVLLRSDYQMVVLIEQFLGILIVQDPE